LPSFQAQNTSINNNSQMTLSATQQPSMPSPNSGAISYGLPYYNKSNNGNTNQASILWNRQQQSSHLIQSPSSSQPIGYHSSQQQQQFQFLQGEQISNNSQESRPPSSHTPSSSNADIVDKNTIQRVKTPTTPTASISTQLNNTPTPRSPLVGSNPHGTVSGSVLSTQISATNADNSNLSFSHDDDTSITSDEPSCSSPKHLSASLSSHTGITSSSSKSIQAHNADILAKLVEMGSLTDEKNGVNHEQRKEFVSRLQKLWEEYNIQCRNLPNISKQSLDLYRLYLMVKEKGGLNEVTKNKLWKDISAALNIGQSASAAFNVRKKYIYLGIFHYECKYDLNGTDPLPIILEMEKASNSNKKPSKNNTNSASDTINSQLQNSTNSSQQQSSNLTNSAKKKKPSKAEKSSTAATASEAISNTGSTNIQQQTPSNMATSQSLSQVPPPNISLQQAANPQQHQQQIGMQVGQQSATQQMMQNYSVQGNFTTGDVQHGINQMNYPQQYSMNAAYYGQPRFVQPAGAFHMQQQPSQQQQSQQTQNAYGPILYGQQQQQPQQIQRMYNPVAVSGTSSVDMYSQQQQQTQQYSLRYPTPQSQSSVHLNTQIQQPPVQQPVQQTNIASTSANTTNSATQMMPPPHHAPSQHHLSPVQIQNQFTSYGFQGQPHQAQPAIYPQQAGSQNQSTIVQQSSTTQQLIQQQQHQQPGHSYLNQQQSIVQSAAAPSATPTSYAAQHTLIPPQMVAISQSPQQQHQQQQLNQNKSQQNSGSIIQNQRTTSTDDMSKIINSVATGSIGASTPQQSHQVQQQQLQQTTAYQSQTQQQISAQSKSQNMPNNLVRSQQQQLQQQNVKINVQQSQNTFNSQPSQSHQQHQPHLQSQQQQAIPQIIASSHYRKEIVFPSDSVEASMPIESKKRKINSKEIGPCDPWKLYMCLKSGLLAESTWALDALNILLYDDNTIAYFHLKHFPGLLNVLIEHFLKCLQRIFDEEDNQSPPRKLGKQSSRNIEFSDLYLKDYKYASSESESEDEYESDKEEAIEKLIQEREKLDPFEKSIETNQQRSQTNTRIRGSNRSFRGRVPRRQQHSKSSATTNSRRTSEAHNKQYSQLNGYYTANHDDGQDEEDEENNINNNEEFDDKEEQNDEERIHTDNDSVSPRRGGKYMASASEDIDDNSDLRSLRSLRANGKQSNSSTITNSRCQNRASKRNAATNLNNNHNILSPSNCGNNYLNEFQLMKINVSERDVRNRYMHFYKKSAYNDSKVCHHWFSYNKRILDKYKRILKNSRAANSAATKKRVKLNSSSSDINKSNTEKQKSAIKNSKSSKPLDNNRHELNDFISTNFSSNDDITSLKKMFFGKNYYEQRSCLKGESSAHDVSHNVEAILFPENNHKNKVKNNQDCNYEFIRKHQSKEPENDFSATSPYICPSGSQATATMNKVYEDEAISEEEGIFRIVAQRRIDLMSRCACISTIIRNLSFVPGNDIELCKNTLLLKILARLLVLKHSHRLIIYKQQQKEKTKNNMDKSENRPAMSEMNNINEQTREKESSDSESDIEDDSELDAIRNLVHKGLFFDLSKSKIKKASTNTIGDSENRRAIDATDSCWWWECVLLLRENTLVTIANIAGALNLISLEEEVIEMFAQGLIHWSICRSYDAQDTLSTLNETSLLSPQRLAIEAISKMTINESNVDLILTTILNTPKCLRMLVSTLCNEWLLKRDEQTMREFAIVILTALAKCDQFAARYIAKHASLLICFLEDFEEIARRYTLINPNNQYLLLSASKNISAHQQHQLNSSNHSIHNSALGEMMTLSNLNEENLGTTIDMLRRCANCIMYLSVYNENMPLIMKHESRLLDLITSQFVDYKVGQTLAEVLFYCTSVMSTNSQSRSSYSSLSMTSLLNMNCPSQVN
jgi:hypothetical protein